MRLRPCPRCYESDLYFEHSPPSIECRMCGMRIGEAVDGEGRFLVIAAWNAEWLEECALNMLGDQNSGRWGFVS